MEFKNKLLTALTLISAIFGICTISLGAETEGYVEAGGMTVNQHTEESAKFMEYRGMSDDGNFPISNFNASYDTEGRYYLDFTGKNLGLDTRNLYLKGGKYGVFKYFIEYDQIEQFISNNSKTIFNGAGGGDLTLPAGFSRGDNTTVSNIFSDIGGASGLKDINLKLDRKIGKAGFSFTMFDDINFDFSFKREQKQGVKATGSLNAGNQTVILPQPIDFVTDTLKAAVRYDTENTHTTFEYYLSKFNNQYMSLKWQNPYSSGSATDPLQVLGTPPDTIHHNFSLLESIKLPWWYTSVSLAASYGIMLQDQAFLPYHAVPSATVNGPTNPLPRQSPDAEIDILSLNANIASRPTSRLSLNARLNYYEMINKTSSNLYRYVTADGSTTTTIPISLSSPQSINNLPYDMRKTKANLDATYLLLPGQSTTLSTGYVFEKLERDFRESDTSENTGKIGIRSNLTSFAQAGVNGLYGKREALNYDGRVVLNLHPKEFEQCLTTTLPAGCGVTPLANARNWFNHPDVRKLDVSDRERYQYNGFVNIFPDDSVTVGLDYSNTMDNFYNTILGLQKQNNAVYTINTTYSPYDALSVYAYYTNQRNNSQQAGRQIGAAAATWYDTGLDWRMDIRDLSHTAGLGLNILLLNEKLAITPEFIYEGTKTAYDVYAGSSFNNSTTNLSQPLAIPDLKSMRYNVNLSGRYKLTEHFTVRAGYLYEFFKYRDWAFDDISLNNPASMPSALLILSDRVQDYIAHMGTIAIAYNW